MNEQMRTDWKSALKKYLPERLYSSLTGMDDKVSDAVEEIRLRASRPLMAYTSDKGIRIGNGRIIVDEEELEQVFGAITGKSAYAFEDDIRQGFLTLESGIRAGLAGSAMQTDGEFKPFKSINGINFRIPREVRGISRKLLPYISKGGRLLNTLIISAPRLGKTTVARDIARCAGSGMGIRACKVSLIDERQELAASRYGTPMFDIGDETDVLSGVMKHRGVFMALRALSPDVIVTDEIGRSEDLESLREVANAGVVMITTAHAPSLDSLMARLFFRKVFEEGLFDAYVVLSALLGRVTVSQIHGRSGQPMLAAPMLLKQEENA